MKNKISDLNNYLFEQIERLNDDSLTEEQLELQLKKTSAINDLAKNIIQNGQLQMSALKMGAEYGIIKQDTVKFLLMDNSKNEKQK